MIVRTKTKATGGITTAEKSAMDDFSKKWIAIAMRTEPINQSKIVPAIKGIYAAAKLKEPRVIIVPSPLVMAFAYGASAWIWHCRKNGKITSATHDATIAATYAATREATSAATIAATSDATYAATHDATIAATIAATRDATDAATRDATIAATDAATRDATIATTHEATSAATREATRAATIAATIAATSDATYAATSAATRDATYAATDAATHDATIAATYAATSAATIAATSAATYDATYAATREATSAATREATYAATSAATIAATRAATIAATRAATIAATSAATIAATRDATDAATSAATSAATREATSAATHDATSAATSAATIAATYAATDAATDAETHDATSAATSAATRTATIAATDAATYHATRAATRAAPDAAMLGNEKQAANACLSLAGRGGLECAKRWVNSYQGGNMWAYWCSYLSAFRDILGLELPEHKNYSHYEVAAMEGGFRVLHEEFCMVCDFPEIIKKDEQNRPHCENGPSHRWRDGWSLYHWHGVSVPAEWIEDKKSLTAKTALTWKNIEQRRAACEIVGWANIMRELKSKVIDADGDDEIGTLLEVDLPDSGKERFLKVLCGTKREFVIPVPKEMKTAIQASAWTYGIDKLDTYKPEVRT